MKKKILIFSAGSAGREVFQLILNINKLQNEWEVIGYVDNDTNKIGKTIDDIQVYSTANKPKKKEIYAICGIMNSDIRKKIFDKEIIKNTKIPITASFSYPNGIKDYFKENFTRKKFCKYKFFKFKINRWSRSYNKIEK